jgi:hypothetical protein
MREKFNYFLIRIIVFVVSIFIAKRENDGEKKAEENSISCSRPQLIILSLSSLCSRTFFSVFLKLRHQIESSNEFKFIYLD